MGQVSDSHLKILETRILNGEAKDKWLYCDWSTETIQESGFPMDHIINTVPL